MPPCVCVCNVADTLLILSLNTMTVTDGIRLCGHYSSGNPFDLLIFFFYIYNIKRLWWVIMDAYCSIKEQRSFLVCYMTKWSPVKNVVHLTFFILNLKYKTKFRIKAILNFDQLCCNMFLHVSCWIFACWLVHVEVYLFDKMINHFKSAFRPKQDRYISWRWIILL